LQTLYPPKIRHILCSHLLFSLLPDPHWCFCRVLCYGSSVLGPWYPDVFLRADVNCTITMFLQFWICWIIKLVLLRHVCRLFMHHFLKLGIVYAFYYNELIMFIFVFNYTLQADPTVISIFNSNVFQTHYICMITFHAHCILVVHLQS
jgi:hypothetical protein